MGVVCRECLWCVFVDLRHDHSVGGTRDWEGRGILIWTGCSESGEEFSGAGIMACGDVDAVDSVLGQSLTRHKRSLLTVSAFSQAGF
jgi:hypothetical protein